MLLPSAESRIALLIPIFVLSSSVNVRLVDLNVPLMTSPPPAPRLKPLTLKLFGRDREIGSALPASILTDLRTLIECYRRGKRPRLADSRVSLVDSELERAFSESQGSSYRSLADLRSTIEEWRAEAASSAFDAHRYYSADRVRGYDQGMSGGSQTNLTERCVELLGGHLEGVVVDLGCGSGLSSDTLLRHSSTTAFVVGMDLSPAMLRCASERHAGALADFVLCDMAKKLPLRGQCVDCVSSTAAVHYLFAGRGLSNLFSDVKRISIGSAAFQYFAKTPCTPAAAAAEIRESARSVGLQVHVVADQPHQTSIKQKGVRWYFLLGQTPFGEAKRMCECPLYVEEGVSRVACMLGWPSVSDEHRTWQVEEHCRFAYRLRRIRRNQRSNGDNHFEREEDTDCRLLKAFGADATLELLKRNSDQVMRLLHGDDFCAAT